MKALLKEIRHNPLLWLLVFVPVVFIATLTASLVINSGRSAWLLLPPAAR
jgi:hypothetical protein